MAVEDGALRLATKLEKDSHESSAGPLTPKPKVHLLNQWGKGQQV